MKIGEKTLKKGGMMKAIDLTGQRFGKLVAVERVENRPGGNAQWSCRCDCGAKKRQNEFNSRRA